MFTRSFFVVSVTLSCSNKSISGVITSWSFISPLLFWMAETFICCICSLCEHNINITRMDAMISSSCLLVPSLLRSKLWHLWPHDTYLVAGTTYGGYPGVGQLPAFLSRHRCRRVPARCSQKTLFGMFVVILFWFGVFGCAEMVESWFGPVWFHQTSALQLPTTSGSRGGQFPRFDVTQQVLKASLSWIGTYTPSKAFTRSPSSRTVASSALLMRACIKLLL